VVREFHYFPCFPVGDRLVGFEALGKSSDGSLHEIVLSPEGVSVGHDFRVVEVAMGDDPGRGPRRTVVGHHGSFRGIAVGLDVVEDEVSLFGSEVSRSLPSQTVHFSTLSPTLIPNLSRLCVNLYEKMFPFCFRLRW